MDQRYDATFKLMADLDPIAVLNDLLGLNIEGLEPLGTNLPMVSVDPDRVWKILGPEPFLLHVEWQSTYDENLPKRCLVYSARLYEEYGLPVLTVIVLLRRSADGKEMTGRRTPESSSI